ncbi:hypothetical protein V6N13_020439 [Hibiscus sabdariffa]
MYITYKHISRLMQLETNSTPQSKRKRESNMSSCPGKNSWPELVGTNGESVKTTIERENPNVDAVVLRDGTPLTGDFEVR